MTVDLGERSYPIYIGSGLLDDGDLIRKHVPGRTALVVTNETIAPLYLDRTVAALESKGDLRVEVIILPDGEKYKTVDVLMKIFDKALESKLDRQTTFVALGGGVIGDMTGFCSCFISERRAFCASSDYSYVNGRLFRRGEDRCEPPRRKKYDRGILSTPLRSC